MQLNPYSTVGHLPRNNIASLMSGASTSMNRMGQSLLSGVDALRSVGMANENELYNTKLTALQNSPEFLNASPMQRQAMVQDAGSGLELDKQNLTGQEQLFKSLGQEQENLNQVDRAKTADENALARLGIDISARELARTEDNTFKSGESDKQRTFDSEEAEKIARATKAQHDIRNNQVFQLVQDNEGNYYKTTVGGDVAGLGVKGLVGGSRSGSGSEKVSDIDKITGTTKQWFNEQNPQVKNLVKEMYGTGRFNIVEIPHETADGKKLNSTSGFVVDGVTYPELESAKKALLGLGENTQKPFDANAIPTPAKKPTEEKNTGGMNRYQRRIEEANAMRAKLGLPPIQ